MSANLTSQFLIAVPQLVGPFFTKSVVLIIDNSDQGSTGVILNHPMNHTLSELNESLKSSRRKKDRLFIGGPVAPSAAITLHDDTYQGLDTKPISGGVAWSTSLESMQVMAESESLPFRCFLGYAGWTSKQLEAEIALGTWLLNPMIPGMIYTDQPKTMWNAVLKEMGLDPLSIGPGAID